MTLRSRRFVAIAGAAALVLAIPVIVCRTIATWDTRQDCITAFDSATNCMITLHDEKYGEGCRILQEDEVPRCIGVGFELCTAVASPWPWSENYEKP